MTWLISLLAAVIPGVAGLLLAGVIANACVSWYSVSSREGASGFFVIFLAIGGGIAGLIVGFITARIISSHYGSGFLRETGAALGVVLIIAGVSALLCRRLADVPPEIDGQTLTLEVEFRFPNTHQATLPPTAEGEWQFTFASLAGQTARKRDYGTLHTNTARFENGQWIVPASVELFTERGQRSVSVARSDATSASGFLLPLPRRPGPEFLEWSDWIPRQQPNGQPWPADRMSCRFRVQKVPLPPPPKTQTELETEKAAELEAEFTAIPADSPVQAWFQYFSYEQPHTQRALQLVSQRPRLVEELSALVVDENPEQAHAALNCIRLLPKPPRELIPAVQAAARLIAERIQKFNQTPKEQDPDFATAVDPATRFYGWLPAAENLRKQCGADLTPELKSILELSRVRPESHCMRSDICRVASYYLHQWAGIEPLPTDPKPK